VTVFTSHVCYIDFFVGYDSETKWIELHLYVLGEFQEAHSVVMWKLSLPDRKITGINIYIYFCFQIPKNLAWKRLQEFLMVFSWE
jgi:hypothetical protein